VPQEHRQGECDREGIGQYPGASSPRLSPSAGFARRGLVYLAHFYLKIGMFKMDSGVVSIEGVSSFGRRVPEERGLESGSAGRARLAPGRFWRGLRLGGSLALPILGQALRAATSGSAGASPSQFWDRRSERRQAARREPRPPNSGTDVQSGDKSPHSRGARTGPGKTYKVKLRDYRRTLFRVRYAGIHLEPIGIRNLREAAQFSHFDGSISAGLRGGKGCRSKAGRDGSMVSHSAEGGVTLNLRLTEMSLGSMMPPPTKDAPPGGRTSAEPPC
jgi:hypothetical protein